MYLKSLEIYGFKSFPERTSLKFEPGITVVVGPNGCGKSNVFDAIKWALGEQKAKSLRGTKMEDIIFNGTDKHPALNYSEVTLNFCNDDQYLPIDYKEVSVTRKLYRSGESEYSLNKNQVRLKDIQALFMGTGIGESTYSFVEQGKIEVFLSYKPEEKRLIFDEASGIVKFKERKKETMRRLKETEQNLLRLEDIISEVQRQIRYLERQVAKAKKYKEVEVSLVDTEKKIAALEIRGLDSRTDNFLEELSRMKKEAGLLEEKGLSLKENKDSFNCALQEIRDQIEEVSSRIISLNSKLELYDNNIRINEQRIEERRLRNTAIEQEQQELERKISFQEKRLEEEKQLVLTIDSDLERLSRETEALAADKEKDALDLERLRLEVAEQKKDILAREVEKANLNNDLVSVQAQMKNLHSRAERLVLDKEKLDSFRKEREDLLLKVSEEVKVLQQEFALLKEKRFKVSAELEENARSKEELEKKRVDKEKELVELRSHFELLKDLRLKYGGISSAQKVKVIFDTPPARINKLIASFKDVDISQTTENGTSVYVAEVEAKVVLFEEGELEQRMRDLEEVIRETGVQIDQTGSRGQELRDQVSQIQNKVSDFDTRLGRKVQEKESISQEVLRLKEELDLLETESKEITGQLAQFEQSCKERQESFETVQLSLRQIKEALESKQTLLSSLQEQIQTSDIELTKKETEHLSLKENKDGLLRRILMSEEDKNSYLRNKERMRAESLANDEKISGLEEENKKIVAQREEEHTAIEALALEKEKIRSREQAILDQREEILSSIHAGESQIEKIRGVIYEKKLRLQEIEFEKTKVKDYLQQVYHIDFSESGEEIEESREMLEEIREKLKKRLRSLGEVNLVAIEEFEELNKRFSFLEEQKNDLVTSKEELKKAIQKINRTSRKIFFEVFTKIKEEFKKNFRYLFGGGRAELVLLDEDNILESGVEIEVQPPGKKLQNVSLLSGGEKALTATALIFAIFKIRPSPLCVLDEIDAPLDEANVDRFNQILRDFAHASQFVVITHNKKTMAMADVLYGVTMQEKGVSKIVSVKFAEESLT